jgi:hypothetical protein
MSYLAQINEYLASTRELSAKQLNKLIKDLDQSAEPVKSQQEAHSVLGYMMSAKIKGESPVFAHAVARVERLKSAQPWLYVEPEVKLVVPGAAAVDEPEEKPVKVKKPRGEKKSDIAAKIFSGLADKSKENVIAVFMDQLGTTRAGAQTYFYAVGGEKSGKRGRKASGAPVKVYVRKTEKTGPTKREQAAVLFAGATDKSRDAIVKRFVTELGLTPAGARTYYYAVGGAPVRKGVKKGSSAPTA